MPTDSGPEAQHLGLEKPVPLIHQLIHDIRSPLNILLGTCGLLTEGVYDPLTAGQQKAPGNTNTECAFRMPAPTKSLATTIRG